MMDRYGNDADDGRPEVVMIAETSRKARKPHPCMGGCSGIEVGEVYDRTVYLVDGEFTVQVMCGWCAHGHPRPGSPEEQQLVAEYEAQARQDEADYQWDQEWHRKVLARPADHDPDTVSYASAAYSGPWPVPT